MNHRAITLFSTLLLLLLTTQAVQSAPPVVNEVLPALEIKEIGEVVLGDDDFSFRPWHSDAGAGSVHVIQYLAATRSASEVFQPFTDRLAALYEPGIIGVTSIINLKAALWGTSGFVLSEVKKNKRKHPESTIVIDKNGTGRQTWGFEKKGAALVIVDKSSVVRFFATAALTNAQLDEAAALVEQLYNE
jgi:YtfJ family uncharacterized protein